MTEILILIKNIISQHKTQSSLRKALFYDFGNLGQHPDAFSLVLEIIRSKSFQSMSAETCIEWKRRLCEELLIASWSAQVPPAILNHLGEVELFDGAGLTFQDAVACPFSSASVFPLGVEDSGAYKGDFSEPESVHLWLFRGLPSSVKDHRHLLDFHNEILLKNPEYLLFIVRETAGNMEKIPGLSFSLALNLSFMTMAKDNMRFRTGLASDWIVTGQVNGGRVEKISCLTSKLELQIKERHWIVPGVNSNELPEIPPPCAKSIRPVNTVEDAWSHISGQSYLEGGIHSWPDAGVLFSFTSGAREPVILAALLSSPEQIVLLHSESNVSKIPAEHIKTICGIALPRCDIRLEQISSGSLIDVEKALRSILSDFNGRRIIFNITQGNRLMALAAHSAARLNPNITLVYRDLDAPDFEFSGISYGIIPPTSFRIMPNSRRNDINWNVLHMKPREPKFSDPLQLAKDLGI